MKFHNLFLLLLLSFLNFNLNWAQEINSIYIIKDSIHHNLPLNKTKNITAIKNALHKNGYFFYSTQNTIKDSLSINFITPGKQTKVLGIRIDNMEIKKILKTNKQTQYIAPKNISSFTENLLNEFDKKGLSFSEIQFTNQELINDTLYCNLTLHKSSKRYINKTVTKGYNQFPEQFIKRYINSKKPFSKSLLDETEQKINQLIFVKNIQKPAVLFTKDSTHLYLYLKKIKANKLDALIGFSNQEGESKIQFNGYIDISLINTLHKGETLAFKWNNSGQDQQEINLLIDKPYIFKTPLNIKYNLNIFKQDSTFINTKQQINLNYKPHYKHSIGTYYKNESSTNLNNTSSDFIKNYIGINYKYSVVNNWRIPKIKLEFDLGYGKRETTTTTTQQTIESDIIYNYELTTNNHIYTRNRNAYLRSEDITINELYRTGGATTIRGFLEQSILSHLYNYTNIEYRYFNNPISYLYVFSDFGHFKNLNTKNNLISLGIGYTLGTPSGLLKISYAVGKNENTTFNLSNGLFHINFVTIF